MSTEDGDSETQIWIGNHIPAFRQISFKRPQTIPDIQLRTCF